MPKIFIKLSDLSVILFEDDDISSWKYWK
jgi:hypothetical protein